MNILSGARNLWSTHVQGPPQAGDFARGDDPQDPQGPEDPHQPFSRDSFAKLGAGLFTAATGVAGYALGAARQAQDVVTHENLPYAETRTVQVGSKSVTGGFHYHYSWSAGKWKYSYDPFWQHQEAVYQQQPTGKTLYHHLTHHTKSFPNTAWGGALLGVGVGLGVSAAALCLSHALAHSDET